MEFRLKETGERSVNSSGPALAETSSRIEWEVLVRVQVSTEPTFCAQYLSRT